MRFQVLSYRVKHPLGVITIAFIFHTVTLPPRPHGTLLHSLYDPRVDARDLCTAKRTTTNPPCSFSNLVSDFANSARS